MDSGTVTGIWQRLCEPVVGCAKTKLGLGLDYPGLPRVLSQYDPFDPEAPSPDGANYYRWDTPDSVIIDDATARHDEIRDLLNGPVDPDILIPLMQ